MSLNVKHPYVVPDMKVTPIRVESGICSASVNITNKEIEQGAIEGQAVNNSFAPDFEVDGKQTEWTKTTAD